MKKFFCIIFFLISSIVKSQQVVELCDGNQTTHIYYSNAGISGGVYVWTIGNNDFVQNPLVYDWEYPGDYIIKLLYISDGGCVDSTFYSVKVVECKSTTMWFPNAFTPNNINGNETWSPIGLNYTDLEYYIFNRWGEQIFKSNSELNPWDGTYKGSFCQEDTYIFIAKWVTLDKKISTHMGRITLIK